MRPASSLLYASPPAAPPHVAPPAPAAPPARAQRLSALAWVTAGAVTGITAVLLYLLAYLWEAPFLGLLVGVLTGLAALALLAVCAGWRWTPAIGALLALVVGVVLVGLDPVVYMQTVTNPREPLYLPLTLLLPLLLVAAGAGIAATVQNYRRPAGVRGAPRWLSGALLAVTGITAGYLLLALIPRPAAALSVSPGVLAQLPAVETHEFQFRPAEIRVQAGQPVALRLFNADKAPHSFDVDELEVHTPMTPGEPGLLLFTAARPGTYTFYCAIPGHSDKATGQGMVGRLVVAP